MNDLELKSKLKSIGSKVFVECFDIFKKYTSHEISKENCIQELVQKYPGKMESGCRICTGNAKLIFEAKMEFRAIKLVCGQTRLSSDTIKQAKLILQKCP